MTIGGDRPYPPRCALAPMIDSHDEDLFRWRLWQGYKVLVISVSDERLTQDERNGVMAIGKRIFEGRNGE